MNRHLHLALVLAACSPAALAQIQLFQVTGNTETAAPAMIGFGSLDAGDSAALSFRLRNTGTAPAQLGAVTVAGTAFLLVAPPVPASLGVQGTFDFIVSFQPSAAGSYSATLLAAGTSVLLTGTAVPALTVQILGPAGALPLPGTVDFGNAALGSSKTVQFAAVNQTAQPLLVPAIAVNGAGFGLSGSTPSGTLLQPLGTATFAIAFAPTQPGSATGSLAIGAHNYSLAGTGVAPPLPRPSMSVNLSRTESAQQGDIAVTLDAPYYTAATGSLTIAFAPAAGISAASADPGIGFASGSLVAPFTVAAGETRASFGSQSSATFATGTTAGTITFTLTFGNSATQQTLTIGPAAAGLISAGATRQAGSITVQVTGFDNTRTAAKLTFTFYDAGGNVIAPGAITADSAADFVNYFRSSGLGGAFALTAVFPVSGGSPSQITAFDFQIANSAGTTHSARTTF
jgi:hypothetical protein